MIHGRISTSSRCVPVIFAIWLAGCGGQSIVAPPSPVAPKPNPAAGKSAGDGTAKDAKDGASDDIIKPPREYYAALFAETLTRLDGQTSVAGLVDASNVLWLNFDGAAVTKGYGRGESFVLCNATAQVPAAVDLSPADRSTIVTSVQHFYDATGAHLTVTADQPKTGDFTTIHVGGTYSDLGCSGSSSILGVAPFDAGNANHNDVGFVFSQGVGDAQTVAVAIAHEAGHTFGLQHVDVASDIMAPVVDAAATGFQVSKLSSSSSLQDEPNLLKQALSTGPAVASSGNPSATVTVPGLSNLPPTLSGLPGLPQIANIGKLLPGLSGNAVDISQLLPQIQALFPQGASTTNLGGLDKILTVVGLASSAGASSQPTPSGSGAGGKGALGGLASLFNTSLASSILGGQGGPLDISKLAQLGGFGSLAGALQTFSGLLGKNTPGVTPAPSPAPTTPAAPASLPNFASLLGLGHGATDLPGLLSNLLGTGNVINGNFSGVDAQALLSLVKVGYAQQYNQLIPGP